MALVVPEVVGWQHFVLYAVDELTDEIFETVIMKPISQVSVCVVCVVW